MKTLILLISMSVFGQNSLFVKQNQYLSVGDDEIQKNVQDGYKIRKDIEIPNLNRNYTTAVSGDYTIDFQIDYQAVYKKDENDKIEALASGGIVIYINGHLKEIRDITAINYPNFDRYEQYRFHFKHYFEANKENRISIYFSPLRLHQNCSKHLLTGGILKIAPFKLEQEFITTKGIDMAGNIKDINIKK